MLRLSRGLSVRRLIPLTRVRLLSLRRGINLRRLRLSVLMLSGAILWSSIISMFIRIPRGRSIAISSLRSRLVISVLSMLHVLLSIQVHRKRSRQRTSRGNVFRFLIPAIVFAVFGMFPRFVLILFLSGKAGCNTAERAGKFTPEIAGTEFTECVGLAVGRGRCRGLRLRCGCRGTAAAAKEGGK